MGIHAERIKKSLTLGKFKNTSMPLSFWFDRFTFVFKRIASEFIISKFRKDVIYL